MELWVHGFWDNSLDEIKDTRIVREYSENNYRPDLLEIASAT